MSSAATDPPPGPGGLGRLTRRARRIGAALAAEYRAGAAGDERPVEPLWPTGSEQARRLAALLASVGRERTAGGPGPGGHTDPASGMSGEPDDDTPQDPGEAQALAAALGLVDWSEVRSASHERSSELARRMRDLAGQVDWTSVQPVAARVSSALIAAVAAGQLPVGGPLGRTVARAITDQGGLGGRVADQVRSSTGDLPPDFRDVIETTARDPER